MTPNAAPQAEFALHPAAFLVHDPVALRALAVGDVVGDHDAFRPARTNPNQLFTRDSLITIPWVPDGYVRGAWPSRSAARSRRRWRPRSSVWDFAS
ncbi:MAG: hypothetical protein ACREOC_00690 [Gemmatimonadales bacterium]